MKPRNLWKCPHCGQEFVSKQGMHTHLRDRRCPVLREEAQVEQAEEAPPPVSPENPRWKRKMVLTGGANIFQRTTDA